MAAELPLSHSAVVSQCRVLNPPKASAACPPAWARSHTSDKSAPSKKCWDCKVPVDQRTPHFCGTCKKIQPPTYSANQFQILGIPTTFDVDAEKLEARYKALQKALHPDKFSTASPREQAFSDAQASAVNSAYDTLRSPLRRARALLRLQGIEPEESAGVDDPELLAYVMEAREEVEGTRSRAGLETLLRDNREREAAAVARLRAAFAAAEWAAAAEAVNRLRYIERIQEAIREKL
ncbi:HSC20 [Auxenochlorella protothecoides x Auxenochlorella symbiontica]